MKLYLENNSWILLSPMTSMSARTRKKIIHVTFYNSEKLPQNHYKYYPRIPLQQIGESIGYTAMLQYPSALIKH